MKIFTLGSNRHLSKNGDENLLKSFCSFCSDLGQAIAENGDDLIICSISQSTTDYYVIEGIKSSKRKINIKILVPEGSQIEDYTAFKSAILKENRNAKVRIVKVDGDWRVAHLNAVKMCDCVIACGGSPDGTQTTIYSSEILETPVALIPGFKGKCMDAFSYFKVGYYSEEEIESFDGDYSNENFAEDVLKSTHSLFKRNPFKKKKNLNILWASITSVLSIFCWLFLTFSNSEPLGMVGETLIILLCSSLIGSSGRFLFESVGNERNWQTTSFLFQVVLGLSMGFLIFILIGYTNISTGSDIFNVIDESTKRRIAFSLSPIIIVSSLFVEESWKRVSEKSLELLRKKLENSAK